MDVIPDNPSIFVNTLFPPKPPIFKVPLIDVKFD